MRGEYYLKIWKVIRNIDKYLGVLILFMMVILVVSQVILRAIFRVSFMGTIDLAQYFLIFIVFISAPYAAREGGHIKMDEIQSLLPKKIQFFLKLFSYSCAVIFFGIISVSAITTTMHNVSLQATPTMAMPFWLFFLPTIMGFFLLAIEYIIILINFIDSYKNEKKKKL